MLGYPQAPGRSAQPISLSAGRMASRKEQKEKARAERVAREEADRREASRKRTLQIGGAVAAVVVIAAVVVVVALGGGDGDDGSDSGSGGIQFSKDSVPAGATVGIKDTSPPWQPNPTDLTQRIEAMGLPGFNETISHTHAWLHVYVDGKQETVPANIGIDPASQTLAALHTHDSQGIVHMEADREFDFTLGQFMAVWGVAFSKDRLGSLTPKGDDQLQVYLNGKRVNDPVNVVMHEHDNLVIGYGKQGSFPTEPKLNWPADL
jgi:hypothetical protein